MSDPSGEDAAAAIREGRVGPWEFRGSWNTTRGAALAATAPVLIALTVSFGIGWIFPPLAARPSLWTWLAVVAPIPAAFWWGRRVSVRLDSQGVRVGRVFRAYWPWADSENGRVRRNGFGFVNEAASRRKVLTLGTPEEPSVQDAGRLSGVLEAVTPIASVGAVTVRQYHQRKVIRRLDVADGAVCDEMGRRRSADRFQGLRCFAVRDAWNRITGVCFWRDGIRATVGYGAGVLSPSFLPGDHAALDTALRRDFPNDDFVAVRLDEVPEDRDAASVILRHSAESAKAARNLPVFALLYVLGGSLLMTATGERGFQLKPFIAFAGSLTTLAVPVIWIVLTKLRPAGRMVETLRRRHPGLEPSKLVPLPAVEAD